MIATTRRAILTVALLAAPPWAVAQEPPALPALTLPSFTPAGGSVPLPTLAPAGAPPAIPSLEFFPAPAATAPKPTPPMVIPLPDDKPPPAPAPIRDELPAPKLASPLLPLPASVPALPAIQAAPPEKPLRSADTGRTVNTSVPQAAPPAAPLAAPAAPPPGPGDAPVTLLPTRQLALALAAGLALSAGPLSPATPATDPAVSAADFQALKKQVEEATAELKALGAGQRAADSLLYGNKDGAAGTDGVLRTLRSLDEKLSMLQTRLDQLDDKVSTLNRTTVGSSPATAGVPQPMAPSAATTPLLAGSRGTVRVVNEYPVEVSLLVNGRSYRVAPNDTRLIDIPAGSYTYELLQSGAQAVTSALKDNETVTLRVR